MPHNAGSFVPNFVLPDSGQTLDTLPIRQIYAANIIPFTVHKNTQLFVDERKIKELVLGFEGKMSPVEAECTRSLSL